MMRVISNKMGKHFSLFGKKRHYGLEKYDIIRELGRGGTSVVYKISDRDSRKEYTCKTLLNNKLENALRETKILRKLKKESCFPQLKHVIRGPKNISIITKYVPGEELFQWLVYHLTCNKSQLTNQLVRHIFKKMAENTSRLHKNGFVHLDIKLENFIISRDDEMTLTMIDFGSGHVYTNKSKDLTQLVGTRGYTPFEIYNGVYSHTTDVWSLGVCLWLLFTGTFAFDHGTLNYNDLKEASRFVFPTKTHLKYEGKIPDDAFILINKMLEFDVDKRMTITEVLMDPWLTTENELCL